MKATLFALFLALLMVWYSSEVSAGRTNKDSSPSEGTETTSPPTNAQDDLFDRFKDYAEANPSLRKSFFTENQGEYKDAQTVEMMSHSWLLERNLQPGYNQEKGLFICLGYGENLTMPVTHCLGEIAGYISTNINAKSTANSLDSETKLNLTAEGNGLGLTVSKKETFTNDTFDLSIEVKVRGKSLRYSYSESGDEFDENIEENGLSPLDLLKYLHHHENVTLGIFRDINRDSYTVILISRISGDTRSRYKTGQKMWEGKYENGKLLTAVAWKPDGEKCPLSNVENGNGFLIQYGTAWMNRVYEIRCTVYKDGQPMPYTGLLKEAYEQRQAKVSTEWKDGKLNGLRTRWLENGQKRSEQSWKNGRVDGPYVSWHENGQKEWEWNYKDGNRDGLQIYYKEDGTESFRKTYRNGEIVED